MNGPLHKVRVLDVSRLLSGPYCTMLLADLGAEVLKLEYPRGGDPARTLEPFVGDDSSFFLSVNRGKKSITLDLSAQTGRDLFLKLLGQCDVLVENFVPGTMAKFGLDYGSVKDANPRLVYASISGFGQDGPEADRPALDIIVQAMGGIMSITGEPDGHVVRPGPSLGDSIAGMFTALAIVTALYQRQETGRGQYIDSAMLDCQVTLMENAFARYFATGVSPTPLGTRHPSAVPFQVFDANDGQFVIALLTNDAATWRRFCEAIARPDLRDEGRYQDNAGRMKHVDELIPELQKTTKQKKAAAWLDILRAADIPCGPINDMKAVSEDPQVGYRNMLPRIPHAQKGSWPVANTPFHLSEAATGPAGPSPKLGEHTMQVFKELLGMGDEEIDALKNDGVI
jgi:CoA:oxalate CoA-transferase